MFFDGENLDLMTLLAVSTGKLLTMMLLEVDTFL